jgi:signal transduction histidine kinase
MKDHLATLGALTAGIAHEINNPLSLVMNNLVLMKLDLTAFKMNPEALPVANHKGIGADVKVVNESPANCNNMTKKLSASRRLITSFLNDEE